MCRDRRSEGREEEMKGWKKWLAGISMGVLVAVLGVSIWQRENVQALWEGMNYNEDQLKNQMETSKEKVKETLEQYEIEGIRDLTVEEEEQLMKGEISIEEALDLIMNRESEPAMKEEESAKKDILENTEGATTPTVSTESIGMTDSKVPAASEETTKPEAGQIVEKYVEKMYTLQATFLSELGQIEARARAVFAQLPKEERNLSTAQKLAPSFINEGLALESQCDGEVSSLLNDFEAELKEAGANTDIIKSMREAYQTQKRLKKAYYLSAIK